MSVGIHSGDAHFFLVGTSHRELVVLGPAATAVVAVESAANSGEILLSAATAAALPESASRPHADGMHLLRWRRSPYPRNVDL
jgi:class 3 adenylate cyclase